MPRVLIADDDPLIRKLLAGCLNVAGHDVISAGDGAEAIALIIGDPTIDVVVTDYQMPRGDGIEVIAAAQRADPNLPCIIVTAFHDLDVAMRAMAAGAVNFLPKPFKPNQLIAAVDRALERRRIATEALPVIAAAGTSATVPLTGAGMWLVPNEDDDRRADGNRRADGMLTA